jgi:hypothetical protein
MSAARIRRPMVTHSFGSSLLSAEGVFFKSSAMTLKAPLDPVADIAAMIRERRIPDRVIYGHVYLSDLAEGREPIPSDRKRLHILAHALGCEARYLDRIVAEWTAFKSGKPKPAPEPKQHDPAQLVEKALAADAQKATLPTKVCTGPCGLEKPISDFYAKGAQCKECRRAKANTYRETHRKKRPLPGVISWSGTYWGPPTSEV